MRKAVLWGHHVAEYQDMFDLNAHDLTLPLLEYGCGPSAINAALHQKNSWVISVDPLFSLSKPQLFEKVMLMFDARVQEIKNNQGVVLNVSAFGGLDAFIAMRRQGLDDFFKDYEQGLIQERYRSTSIDLLPFADFTFHLALSSHYFFAGETRPSVEEDLVKIKALARLAKEVRIFPLLTQPGVLSPALGPVLLGLQHDNYGVEVREVSCALYPAGNAMLRVWARECVVSSVADPL